MLEKKFYLNEIEAQVGEETVKLEGFTDDSYVVIDIPSMREKLALKSACKGKSDEEIETITIDKIYGMVVKVSVETIEGDQVHDMDTLSVYPIAGLVYFLENLIRNGYMPKKIKSV
jgi:hypothetical protein